MSSAGPIPESAVLRPAEAGRRGRRFIRLLLGAMVGAAALGGWWFWPRGDTRFVGSWVLLTPQGNAETTILTFFAHGAGRTRTPQSYTVTYPWAVTGDRLVMGRRVPVLLADPAHWLRGKVSDLSRVWIQLEEETYDIVTVTAERIDLRDTATGVPIAFERVSE